MLSDESAPTSPARYDKPLPTRTAPFRMTSLFITALYRPTSQLRVKTGLLDIPTLDNTRLSDEPGPVWSSPIPTTVQSS